jgi:hypothetical protein
MKLFNRKYRLVLEPSDVAADARVREELTIEDLDIEFTVRKEHQLKPNTAEVTIYNLSDHNRARLTQNKHDRIQIHAGYEEGISMIFRGDVREVRHEKGHLDWETRITAGDGERACQTARVSRSFGPDASVETVLRACCEAMGIGIGNAVEAIRGASLTRVGQFFPRGTVLHGQANRQLQALARSCGFDVSIQSNTLFFTLRGRAQLGDTVFLSPDTGLLTVPQTSKKGVVTAECLLIPSLAPGRLVMFGNTSGTTGSFRIEKIEYRGETHGTDWTCKLECRPEVQTRTAA